ncbi:TIR domain-containing protein [Sphingomonas sp. CFBP 13720]|uniref:TIR domain-containing protein n=1 Tax=Sphingomonas sp. CFBP 13720 TaxID=2775302 RepID=UPI0018DA3076
MKAPEIRIFVSYSHRDAAAQEKLQTHLAPWKRDDVTVWYDKNIEPGAQLDPAIARELRNAHIFVALFSPAYLDSNYCWKIEYKRAMNRRARNQLRVVGVVVKPCGWKQTRAAGFKLLPEDGREPERWSSYDAAYVNIAEGIGAVIKTVRRELAAAGAKRPGTVEASAKKPKTPVRKTPTPGKARAKQSTNPIKIRARSRKT